MYEELIEDLSRRGLSNGTTLGYHSGLMEAAADALKDVTAQLTAKDAEIERLTAERDAAVELIGKLDRCVMLLSADEESLAPNPAVRHAIHFAVNAIENWRTPEKQDEEG